MKILSGTALAASFEDDLKREAAALTGQGIRPGLAVIQVGEEPATQVYVRSKVKTAERVGMHSVDHKLPATVTQADLEAVVDRLNRAPHINGVLCQMPLPPHLDGGRITRLIDPLKDVDCFHPYNVGLLALGEPRFLPCTPAGILELLTRSGIAVRGKHTVVLGRSNIVGRPLSILLSQKGWDATVTVCHSRSEGLVELARQADILVAALGKPEFVRAEMVKPGAVVIDVGVNRVADPTARRGYRLCGDVHFAGVAPRTSAITPVPGGVGPMTIAMLLRNTLVGVRLQHGLAEG
ncbi:MAG: bifunctional 5,10-methylenetetrahydrofolate dehydrogenase/5,10-methenyltetrahydrofolate cyclohydrolase [Candidatus Lambdaproteobacteria bacterium]|nr:bifunctional 5,10-methylenetetrahydrofolate dehydrogenase/5,10-methenyltetrahydrofolate cyclohydrolase [Candidatus Lambdaproteobacteria bacterium]